MKRRRECTGSLDLRRVLLIVNPASRHGDSSLSSATRAFARSGIECDVVYSERPGHAGELAAHMAHNYDALFSLGGDGTAIEVIAAVAASGPPVGVLPGGTGNLLARALAIPMRVADAVTALVSGSETRMDLGSLADGSRFAIGVGMGIDAAMIASTSREWKRRVGVLAYIVAGVRHTLRRPRFNVEINVDGQVTLIRASAVLVVNVGVLLNGLITLGSDIRYDDGLLDVCVFDPMTFADVIRVAGKLMFRNFSPDRAMTYKRGRHISVYSDPPLPVQADGELIGTTPVVATVEPLAARLLVPSCQINRH